jgi:hypothetical protein
LTNVAGIFQEEYELDVREGLTATFGDVLWALGNKRKNRLPAQPREGCNVPIHNRLNSKEWKYCIALNELTNPRCHNFPITEVGGAKKLILPAEAYKPEIVTAMLVNLGIVEKGEKVVIQKESELTESEKKYFTR